MTLKAIIFDVDGTLAETEEVHRAAFNDTFEDNKLDWYWSRDMYRELLKVTGGKERMRSYQQQFHPEQNISDQQLAELHRSKTQRYSRMLSSSVSLRPGVAQLIQNALVSGIRLAIATTTTEANVTALANAVGDELPLDRFEVIVGGQQVPDKKPSPAVYLEVLKQMQLPAQSAVAIEDSNAGLRAAQAADLACVITPSEYTREHDFSRAEMVVESLASVDLLSVLASYFDRTSVH
jgi:HAD superfamily hydrolase (TIGR01509 family)